MSSVPACAGLHRLNAALQYLRCPVHAAADHHAGIVRRLDGPLFKKEDNLYPRLCQRRDLCPGFFPAFKRLVFLPVSGGRHIYRRLHQLGLYGGFSELLSDADHERILPESLFHQFSPGNLFGGHDSGGDLFLQSCGNRAAAGGQRGLFLYRGFDGDADQSGRKIY